MSKRIDGNERTADKKDAINLIKTFHKRLEKQQAELDHFFEKNHNKTYKDAGLPALILLIDKFGALKESWENSPKKRTRYG